MLLKVLIREVIMSISLYVKNFGKIEEANIEVKPLTLLVGDNNSGKSYLMSLIWGLHTSNSIRMLFFKAKNIESNPLFIEINEKITAIFKSNLENDNSLFEILISVKEFEAFFNFLLNKYKNDFLKYIFNSDKVDIEYIAVKFTNKKDIKFKIMKGLSNSLNIEFERGLMVFPSDASKHIKTIVKAILMESANAFLEADDETTIYLPSARTGFILSKNALNRYGRNIAFDFYSNKDNYINNIPVFTKPILYFLNKMDSDILKKTQYNDIIAFIENNMTNGEVKYLNESSKEIGYVPSKFNDIFPLRITSALVTELSPLILLLKSNPKIKTLCYEEPEMCLHPKYQELIARVLIKLVNKNINIIATTHSDIILQHINNMGVLSKVDEDRKCQIMEKFSFNNNDLINLQRINVYQLSIVDNVTKVKKIEVNKLGFDVHSFSDVLSELLKKSLVINRSIEEKND